ncbi:MAG: GDSL-type esterase/lipase family protein [Myxococcota bacterium]
MNLAQKTTVAGTALTLAAFVGFCVGLSAMPIPEDLKPLDIFDHQRPFASFWARLVSRPQAVPRPSQGYVAGGGALNIAEEDTFVRDDEAVETTIPHRPVDAHVAREAWTPPERPFFDRFKDALHLSAASLERPCVEPPDASVGPGCQRRALDRFFDALRAAESSRPSSTVRVIYFGDSLIASDKITDTVRARLQDRFGAAGRGFLMVRKFNRFQRGHRTGRGTGGWVLDVITQGVLQDRYFGYTGAAFTAQKAGEQSVFEPVGGARQLELYYLQEPHGGVLTLTADGLALGEVDTRGASLGKRAQVASFALPPGTDAVTLRAETHGGRVFGVALEAEVPGVVLESIGLPGATSEVWVRPHREDFLRMLAHRQPDLVVLMVGGNDALMLSKRRATEDRIKASMDAFFQRIAAAVPEADCLVVTPLESVRAKADGRMEPKAEVHTVMALQRRVARRHGCGVWDLYRSMGGEGSLRRWVDADLMLGDLIHPRSRGSDLLGEMMAEALMEGYDTYRAGAAEAAPPSAP